MLNFISVNDVENINALVAKALQYKANPFADKALGAGKRIGLLFLIPIITYFFAQRMGRNPIKWFLISLILPGIASVIFAIFVLLDLFITKIKIPL